MPKKVIKTKVINTNDDGDISDYAANSAESFVTEGTTTAPDGTIYLAGISKTGNYKDLKVPLGLVTADLEAPAFPMYQNGTSIEFGKKVVLKTSENLDNAGVCSFELKFVCGTVSGSTFTANYSVSIPHDSTVSPEVCTKTCYVRFYTASGTPLANIENSIRNFSILGLPMIVSTYSSGSYVRKPLLLIPVAEELAIQGVYKCVFINCSNATPPDINNPISLAVPRPYSYTYYPKVTINAGINKIVASVEDVE